MIEMKARTHMLTFAESTLESVLESADSTTNCLPLLNMLNISTLIQSADSSRPTIAVGGLQIGLVGMGLE